jgi:hypothetical protein
MSWLLIASKRRTFARSDLFLSLTMISINTMQKSPVKTQNAVGHCGGLAESLAICAILTMAQT